jgi:putative tryptophan/tyrosine transport system substrate-binding protein
MRRRSFLRVAGGLAVTWPLAAGAQKSGPQRIGWLDGRSAVAAEDEARSARLALRQSGFVEGQNVGFEYRWADGQYHRLPALAAELAARRVDVLAAVGGPASVHAAKAATTNIPIVFTSGADPIRAASLPVSVGPVGISQGSTS